MNNERNFGTTRAVCTWQTKHPADCNSNQEPKIFMLSDLILKFVDPTNYLAPSHRLFQAIQSLLAKLSSQNFSKSEHLKAFLALEMSNQKKSSVEPERIRDRTTSRQEE